GKKFFNLLHLLMKDSNAFSSVGLNVFDYLKEILEKNTFLIGFASNEVKEVLRDIIQNYNDLELEEDEYKKFFIQAEMNLNA
ncbi:MAG: hypothetical protein MJ252_10095, partial [archaeon]|nr:hypothetical protein [archaeon]